MNTPARNAFPRSALILDAKIAHPRISSIERIEACREAAAKYSDVTVHRLAHHVGGLEYEVARLCREYGMLRTAYLQSLGDDGDQPTDAQISRIARSMADRAIRHGTAHVSAPPPWPIPEAVRKALDASVRGMLGGDDDEDEYEAIPRGTAMSDEDLVAIVETIGSDVRAEGRRAC